MKAKYHKNSSVFEGELGYRPSFIWRSLLSAQSLLREGLRWRAGNVASIRVWGDCWIPNLPEHFIPSAPAVLPVDATVRELVDPTTN
ncbi:hypothetical protein LINGRAHAP2_LOCUS20123 [Linum grandiflorum]